MHNPGAAYTQAINELFEQYKPSKNSFFKRLREAPTSTIQSPALLGELYLRYQAAMHATRAMVYNLPYLDRPSLRIRKCRIYQDDDGLAGGDTHHHQLARAFRNMGAVLPLEDDEFGELEDLVKRLDPNTARFVSLVHEIYPRSLGPWCIVELLSDDWMHALADGLSLSYPQLKSEPYFADVFNHGVEERHGREAMEVTISVLERKPHLLEPTIQSARAMAAAVDDFWSGMNELLEAPLRSTAA